MNTPNLRIVGGKEDLISDAKAPLAASVEPGGSGPYDGDMEKRVEKLEETMIQTRQDLSIIRSNYATREFLHKEIGDQTWKLITWVTGVCTLLVVITYYIATHGVK